MAPRWRKVLRDASSHKGRTGLVVLALATGLTAAGALLDAASLVRRATESTYLASLPVSATLRVDRIDDEALREIRAVPDVAAVHVRRSAMATLDTGTGELTAVLFAPDAFENADMARMALDSGRWPASAAQIAIEKSSLEFSRLAVGDAARLRVGRNDAMPLEVVGVAHDVSLAPGWMDHMVYGFVTAEALAHLDKASGSVELQLRARNPHPSRDEVRAIASTVRTVAERHGSRVLGVHVPVPNQHVHAAQMDSLMMTQGVFALAALAACALLVVNLMAAMLAGQAREIAVMKAIGAGARQIAAMYLGFALAVGVAASAIAVPAAAALGRPYAALKAEMLNFPIDGMAIPAASFALQLAVGALLPVVAAAFAVWRACRAPVAHALRDGASASMDGALFVTRRIAIPGVSRPLMLSLNNAFRSRARMLLTLATLAAGGAVFVAAYNLRASVIESVDGLFASQREDFILRVSDPQPPARLESLVRGVDGIAAAEAWAGTSASAVHPDGMPGDNFLLAGIPVPSTLLVPGMTAGRWLLPDDEKALVATRALARDDERFAPGNEVALSIGGAISTWKVIGLVEGVGQPIAYARREALAAVRGDDRAAALAVAASPAYRAAPLGLIARTRSALEAGSVRVASSNLLAESRRSMEDHLLLVVQFLGAMGWVMLAVGGMGLASTLGLAVLERTREIGVMRAIGASHSSIAAMLQGESLVIGGLAWLAALVLSVPASVALGHAFGAVMFPIPMHGLPDLAGSAAWLAVVAAICVVACAGPCLRALRIPAARALAS